VDDELDAAEAAIAHVEDEANGAASPLEPEEVARETRDATVD
jgi:hypothetical protein